MRYISKTLFFLIFLVVFLTEFTGYSIYAAGNEAAVSGHIPWSGWWWPTRSGGLATGIGYRGSPAPLEKYDLLTGNVMNGPATRYYEEHTYDQDALRWEGLCDAWAAAAIREPIEFFPSVINNLVFRIGDKKGLMTYAHELSFMTGQYQVMDEPLVLHNWLQQYIRDRKTAFVAELDPSEELWNYPVYKYEMNTLDFGNEEQVICTIWYADDNVKPDYSGTKEMQKTYHYTLYKSGDMYVSSEWGLQSSYDHPSRVYYPESAGTPNPYLDYDTVKNISESRDDVIESDLPVALTPGTYNLILLDPDQYILDGTPTDSVRLSLTILDDTREAVHVMIKDGADLLAYQADVDTAVSIPLIDFQPPFEITITKPSYENPGIYQLTYDVKKNYEFARPKAQKGFGWGGYAIVNSTDKAIDNIMVSGYDSSGLPIDTFLGPFSLAPGKKQTVMSAEFPYRNQLEKEDFYGIKVHAPQGIALVNLSGVYQDSMASFSAGPASSVLVIPEYPDMFDFNMTKTWGIYHPGIDTATVSFSLYSLDGQFEDAAVMDFAGRQIRHFKASSAPFTGFSDNGWVLVESTVPLSGYEEWLSRSNDTNEVIPALIPDRLFYLPNPVENRTWHTRIVVINTSDMDNTITVSLLSPVSEAIETIVTLRPYQKIQTSLLELFPDVSADQATSSIMRLTSDHLMAGFYSYTTDQAGDVISMPFTGSGDIRTIHTIPHIASDTNWWTGLVLCNSGDTSSTVRILPYDTSAQVMPHAVTDVVLKPNEKYNNLVSHLLDLQAMNTLSHIRIEVIQGSPVFGTYGYGSTTMKMLTGLKL